MFEDPDDFLEAEDSTKMERIDSLEDLFVDSEVLHAKKAGVSIDPEKPKSPVAGDVWLDRTTGSSYVYYPTTTSSQWIQIGGTAAL